jgi:hypothetical protein
VGELTDAVREARRGPRVVAVSIDRNRETGKPQAGCALGGFLRAEPARSDHHQLGPGGDHLAPRRGIRRLTGPAEDVDPARALDHLRQPVPGTERRVDPLGEEHPAARQVPHGRRGGFDRLPHVRDDLLAARSHAKPRCQDAHGLAHLAKRSRIEREHLRPHGTRGGELAARDGAHGAEILGDDQVGSELGNQVGVDAVQGPAVPHRFADHLADLQARERRGIEPRDGHDRLAGHLGRPAALLRDPDERIDEPEVRDHLRRTRQQ